MAVALEFPFQYMQTVYLRFSRARTYARVSRFAKKSLHPSPGGRKMMSMSWFSVKTLLKTSLHLAFTGVLIIRNEIADYASVNFPVFKSLHP